MCVCVLYVFRKQDRSITTRRDRSTRSNVPTEHNGTVKKTQRETNLPQCYTIDIVGRRNNHTYL